VKKCFFKGYEVTKVGLVTMGIREGGVKRISAITWMGHKVGRKGDERAALFRIRW
jgi:hypothetical protein